MKSLIDVRGLQLITLINYKYRLIQHLFFVSGQNIAAGYRSVNCLDINEQKFDHQINYVYIHFLFYRYVASNNIGNCRSALLSWNRAYWGSSINRMTNDITPCCKIDGHCFFGSWTILGDVIFIRNSDL